MQNKNLYKYAFLASGLGSILLGLLVIIGWYTHNLFLIQVHIPHAMMAYNVALLFILTGIALLANSFMPTVSLIMLLMVATISSLTLLELLSSYAINLDKLFFDTSSIIPSYTGRPAPNTIISFLLISVVLLLLRTNYLSKANKTIVTLSGSIIVTSFGVIALIGLLYSLPFTYEWINYNAMAIHTAVGLSIIGFSLILGVWQKEEVWSQGTEVIFPSLIAAVGTLTFLMLWQFLIKGQIENTISNLLPNLVLLVGLSTTYLSAILYRMLVIARHTSLELQESEHHTKTIIETAGEAYIAANSESRIIDWNKQAEVIFGWSKNEVIGKLLTETIIPKKYEEAHLHGMKHYLETGEGALLNKRIEITATRKDGREFLAELIISPLQHKNEKIFNAFLRDITKRKELERIKNEFISLASHELRTPLTAIHGAVSLLSEFIKPENKQIEKLLQIARENTNQLKDLINNILDIEKMEAGKATFVIQTVSLQQVLKKAVRLNRVFADKYHIKLCLVKNKKYKYIVDIDPDRLMQVMNNLISNAVKYSFKHGVVKIKTTLMNENTVKVSVIDKGLGIPHEFKETIFDKFTQAKNEVNAIGSGTGLGLHISKSIIEQLGGEISFKSDGDGTTFFFTLPLVRKSTKIFGVRRKLASDASL